MERRTSTIVSLILVVILLTLAIAGIAVGAYFKLANKVIVDRGEYEMMNAIAGQASQDDYDAVKDKYKKYEKFIDIQGLIDDSFLWDYDAAEEMEAVYRAMLGSLGDQYTRYLDEEELEALILSMNSSFTGVGVVFMQTDDGFIITEVIKDGPADAAGLKAGDYILKVDGKEFEYSDDMAVCIRGEAGTQVKLLIKRDDKEIEFDIVRGKIETATVESATLEDGKIGYIRIKSFGDDTAKMFDSALSSLEGQNVEGLIIDLRNNGGGLFDAGVSIADTLLPDGVVSYAEDKNGKRTNYNSDSRHTDLPIVVITNEATASTSEMLAAALKDYDAILVGTTTYGKGVMQETHFYNDGTAVNVTVRQFFSPKGNVIHGVGVEPTEVVPLAEGLEDTQLARAIEILQGK
ncbi:MAG: S41 family peptidase [Firmicutes bacterium]|nr:S41 family peptidase [Bacillota bacterium]